MDINDLRDINLVFWRNSVLSSFCASPVSAQSQKTRLIDFADRKFFISTYSLFSKQKFEPTVTASPGSAQPSAWRSLRQTARRRPESGSPRFARDGGQRRAVSTPLIRAAQSRRCPAPLRQNAAARPRCGENFPPPRARRRKTPRPGSCRGRSADTRLLAE